VNLEIVVSLMSCSVAGCFWVTTKREGDALHRHIDSLSARTSTKARALDAQIDQRPL
jgi:hypothetical protein